MAKSGMMFLYRRKSLSGTGVTLYSDSACSTAIATDTATSTLTVYAKGTAAGNATVTVTSNADSTKTASCAVTVEVEAITLRSALVNGAVIKVKFKWREIIFGDYVQGVYNAASGTFTASKGGSGWGRDERAVYKVEKSGDNIIIGAGFESFENYSDEGMVWTFNTTNDTYTTTNGDIVNDEPGEYGLISVTLNGTDITSQLTAQ